jgi:hypothetical protein
MTFSGSEMGQFRALLNDRANIEYAYRDMVAGEP